MVENKFTKAVTTFIAYFGLIILIILTVLPMLTVLSTSFSDEKDIIANGCRVLPFKFSLDAYKYVFTDPKQLLNAYMQTIIITVFGTVARMLVTGLAAYVLSRKDYKFRRFFNYFFYFTMLFSGGAIASYILITQYLHMQNTYMVFILPTIFSVGDLFLLRAYFATVSSTLIEAAKIDGAGEWRILFVIVVPIAKIGIMIVSITTVLYFWNIWYESLIYMTNDKIVTLQYYLYRILNEIQFIQTKANTLISQRTDYIFPNISVRMALCMLAAGPMTFIFMFFQKYFQSGIVLGSVKG